MRDKGEIFGFICLILAASALFVPTKEARAAGTDIPISFNLEHPYSITGIRANGEFIDLDNSGSLFMNQIRADVNLYQNLLGVYAKFPFAGVTDFGPGNDGDYNLGNIGVGGKVALLNLDSAILTGGFEVILPTADNDDLSSLAAQAYFRDFSYFQEDALTLKPYVVLGLSKGIVALQANFDAEILTSADEIEGDSSELILKYGATASISPNLPLPFSTSFLLEVLFASSVSSSDDITGGYITPGVRLGGQIISLGAGVQIPFGSDEITDFANVGFVVDLIVRFGT
ncbi:MAG: hypothetical protein ACT4NX_08880 [Deltaproteobacteria bacterium]